MKLSVFTADETQWLDLLASTPHDIYHLPSYLKIEGEFRGARTELFVVTDGSNFLATPLILSPIPATPGEMDASSPYGYAGPICSHTAGLAWVKAAFAILIQHLRERHVISLFLRFHPILAFPHEALEEHGAIVTLGETVAMALQRPFDTIQADIRKGTRYDIRRAQRNGQVARLDTDWEHLSDFRYIYASTMARVEARSEYLFSAQYFDRLRYELAPHVALWVTTIGDQVAAASLVTERAGIVQYHLSGTHSDFLELNPTKVLLAGVAQWANERGNRWFHLGGGLGAQNDSLMRFKAGFSRDRFHYKTGRIIVNPLRFHELTLGVSGSPDFNLHDAAAFFPPYRGAKG